MLKAEFTANSGRLLIGCAVSGMLFMASAHAEERGWGGYDDDNDGRVTFEEVMRHVEPSVRKSFDALDRNHDGAISNEDFDDVHEGMRRMEEWLYRLIKPFLPRDEEPTRQI